MTIEAVLPPGAAYATARIEDWTEADVEALPLPATLAGAAWRRKREFHAGRQCAYAALRALLGPGEGRWNVAVGEGGAPQWPVGTVGSITHTRVLAAAVVMPSSIAQSLGLDAEHFMTEARAESTARVIASAGELEPLMAMLSHTRAETLTMVFSAKEAIFKCLYPAVRRRFGYDAAAIEHLDLAAARFSARLLVTLTPELTAGTVIGGRIAVDAATVFACVHVAGGSVNISL